MNNKETNTLSISKKSFFTSFFILISLIVFAGILTRFIPSGTYRRSMVNGRLIIDPNSFAFTLSKKYPIYRWFTAPIEVLWGEDSTIIIAIILFILIIGGSFTIISKCKILEAAIGKLVKRVGNKKYYLLSAIVFIFMLMGSLVGTFEEVVPLIPVAIALSYSLGWDSLTGLGMSLLSAGFGFASGIANPFSVGVAQKIAELPLFSGVFYRIIVFIVIFIMLSIFLIRHAKKIENNPQLSSVYREDINEKKNFSKNIDFNNYDKKIERSMKWFLIILALTFIIIISSTFITVLSTYSLPIIALMFLIAGIGCGILYGFKLKEVLDILVKGAAAISPGVVLILMASSVKHIIKSAGIMDTILYYASSSISSSSPFMALFLIYIFVLLMNFFIASGSAKAFLIMPIITPLADLIGINRQLTVLAFAFGDGFSNVIYPTNAVLLIGLGLTVISYPKWAKWIIKLQIAIFIATTLLLYIAFKINLGPF